MGYSSRQQLIRPAWGPPRAPALFSLLPPCYFKTGPCWSSRNEDFGGIHEHQCEEMEERERGGTMGRVTRGCTEAKTER